MTGKYRLSLLFLTMALADAAAGAPDQVRQRDLRHLLIHDCGSCHGTRLAGGLGPALLPQDLVGKPDEALAAIILNGVPGSAMPPWRPFLTEDETRWLVEIMKRGLE